MTERRLKLSLLDLIRVAVSVKHAFRSLMDLVSKSVGEFIASADPLSTEALKHLVQYKEEDDRVDYKLTFDPDVEKQWLEMTKDIVAFANTNGGYLVYGMKNGSFDLKGITPELSSKLTDTDEILKKVNRFLDPPLESLRSKRYVCDNLLVAALYIPCSENVTHVISRNATYLLPSGCEKTLLHEGTIYIRRSAGNKLVKSRDLDSIFQRRFESAKASLHKNIARVIDAPQGSNIVVVPEGQKVRVVDDPDAIPVMSRAFTVSPETVEEEIDACIALEKAEPRNKPIASILWKWYGYRGHLELSEPHRLKLAGFCLLEDVPVFYWLRDICAKDIKAMLVDLLRQEANFSPAIGRILKVATFLGSRSHGSIVKLARKWENRLDRKSVQFPIGSPHSLFNDEYIKNRKRDRRGESEDDIRKTIIEELEQIVGLASSDESGTSKAFRHYEAIAFDCFLYARDDFYQGDCNKEC